MSMQVLKPVWLVRKKVCFWSVVQYDEFVASIETVTKPLVNAAVDAGITETVAANDKMHMRCKMASKRGEKITKKANPIKLLFDDRTGKKCRLPFNRPYQIAILIVAVKRV